MADRGNTPLKEVVDVDEADMRTVYSCSVDELQKCLKENQGDRTKCEVRFDLHALFVVVCLCVSAVIRLIVFSCALSNNWRLSFWMGFGWADSQKEIEQVVTKPGSIDCYHCMAALSVITSALSVFCHVRC